MSSSSQKVIWPATERNKVPIGDVLEKHLRGNERVLEIASGTGQHADYLCTRFADKIALWQPTELDAALFESINAFRSDRTDDDIIAPPVQLDCTETWPKADADDDDGGWTLIGLVNVMHISPARVFDVFFERAKQVTSPNALIYVYGPFKENNQFTTESNRKFDQSLRQRNSEWGYKDAEQLIENAKSASFRLVERNEMPANNLCFIFQKK